MLRRVRIRSHRFGYEFTKLLRIAFYFSFNIKLKICPAGLGKRFGQDPAGARISKKQNRHPPTGGGGIFVLHDQTKTFTVIYS